MNMAKYGSRRSQQAANANFEPIIRGLKVIFFTETTCKIHVIYVGFNCKRKNWGKNVWKLCPIRV